MDLKTDNQELSNRNLIGLYPECIKTNKFKYLKLLRASFYGKYALHTLQQLLVIPDQVRETTANFSA